MSLQAAGEMPDSNPELQILQSPCAVPTIEPPHPLAEKLPEYCGLSQELQPADCVVKLARL